MLICAAPTPIRKLKQYSYSLTTNYLSSLLLSSPTAVSYKYLKGNTAASKSNAKAHTECGKLQLFSIQFVEEAIGIVVTAVFYVIGSSFDIQILYFFLIEILAPSIIDRNNYCIMISQIK